MTDFDTPSIQPEQPSGQTSSMRCPDCGTGMHYRGERMRLLAGRIREEIFYCPVCDVEILRPRKI